MRHPESCPALLLNADFRPISVQPLKLLPWQDVVQKVIANRLTVLDEYDVIVRSPGGPGNQPFEMFLPSVVAQREYVNLGKEAPFTRLGVYIRDRFKCAYCQKRFPMKDLTFDHVMPRSKGGGGGWTNLVTACIGCNSLKADKKAEEVGLKLHCRPYAPTRAELNAIASEFPRPVSRLHHTWLPWLGLESQAEMAEPAGKGAGAGLVFPEGMTSEQYWNVELTE